MAAAKLTITKVWNPHAKIGAATATFLKDGEAVEYPNPLKWWVSAPFNADLVVGAVLDIEVEKKPNDRDPEKLECWVKSVNGVTEKPAAARGAGARAFTPKTAAEIHSASVAGIIKSAIENQLSTEQAKEWLSLYRLEMVAFGNHTQGKQGAS